MAQNNWPRLQIPSSLYISFNVAEAFVQKFYRDIMTCGKVIQRWSLDIYNLIEISFISL